MEAFIYLCEDEMPELRTHPDLRKVQKLPFCYLCGTYFVEGDDRNGDHVPPKAIFAVQDRDPPLKLPTHTKCNSSQSAHDEVIGQLVAAIHGKYPDPQDIRLRVVPLQENPSDARAAVVTNINVHKVIRRWIRGFHAALYGEFLPSEAVYSLHPPFPPGEQTDGVVVMEDILPEQPAFVEIIKKNRIAKRLDRIECFNGKCEYECTWGVADDGRSICIFGLNIYDWKELGDTINHPARSCVGMYIPAAGKPSNATQWTQLEFRVPNVDKLDAFSE